MSGVKLVMVSAKGPQFELSDTLNLVLGEGGVKNKWDSESFLQPYLLIANILMVTLSPGNGRTIPGLLSGLVPNKESVNG